MGDCLAQIILLPKKSDKLPSENKLRQLFIYHGGMCPCVEEITSPYRHSNMAQILSDSLAFP